MRLILPVLLCALMALGECQQIYLEFFPSNDECEEVEGSLTVTETVPGNCTAVVPPPDASTLFFSAELTLLSSHCIGILQRFRQEGYITKQH